MSVTHVFSVAAAILTSVGGASAIIFFLSSWLGKVWANRILEQDRARYGEELARLKGEVEAANRKFQAELDKRIYVHRVHFETEFGALKEIWKAASMLRTKISGLRPRMDFAAPNGEYKVRLQVRIKEFRTALVAFQDAVDNNSPFYPSDVFRELETLLQIAKREELQVDVTEVRDKEWFEDGERNRTEFFAQARVVSAMIRARIMQLSISKES
jgi:hypothetical protein